MGTTEKVLQFLMPLKSIYNKNLGFIEQKHIFEHYKEVQTIKNVLIDIIFIVFFFLMTLFRAAPYSLMLVFNNKERCAVPLNNVKLTTII